ncbi:MAG: non-hydrolyzing UDP-N-acetylglucosamine 2-epimerase [Candidatus Margulisiibacteriota bacterium]
MKSALFVFGTRPEAIKLAPLVLRFKEDPHFVTQVCVTGQHREMLDQVLAFFGIVPDFDLNLMKPNQTLFDITAEGLKGLQAVIATAKPDLLVVQGDTTTAFIGALAGFYTQTKVAHVEAGLRSGQKQSPFPEEINRIMAGHLADFHFAPTPKAKANLACENIHKDVWVVGNTVIDALFLGLEKIKQNESQYASFFAQQNIDFSQKIILVTGHRRESFGKPFEEFCLALKTLADTLENTSIVYPVHLNPNVQEPVFRILGNHTRIHLIDPLPYPHLLWLLNACQLVITDSGGIQEEAPALGKPVLVTRTVTERTEGIDAGTAKLIGTNPTQIVAEATRLLTDSAAYAAMATAVNPYGDGTTCTQILNLIKEHL